MGIRGQHSSHRLKKGDSLIMTNKRKRGVFAPLFFFCYDIDEFFNQYNMCPSYYQSGGAMLPPEAIANRKASAKGKAMVFKTKKDLVDHVVELNSRLGRNISQVQKTRYEAMRRDQLEKIVSNLTTGKIDNALEINTPKK